MYKHYQQKLVCMSAEIKLEARMILATVAVYNSGNFCGVVGSARLAVLQVDCIGLLLFGV